MYVLILRGIQSLGLFKTMCISPLTHLTLHPLTDLFVPTPSRLLWEAFGHAAIAARRPLIKSISVCSQILINTTEVSVATWGERNCQSFETPERCFETGFSFKPLRHQTQATRVCTTVYQILHCIVYISSASVIRV